MSNKEIKYGGILVAGLMYFMVFGVKVTIINGDLNPSAAKCKSISTPIVQSSPSMPVIDKAYLDDKAYVIRVLVTHINNLDKHIAESTKQTADLYTAYAKCTAP